MTLPHIGPAGPDDPIVYQHSSNSLAGIWASSQNISHIAAERASGSLDWIPTYGNYGGNDANDAWNMASSYFGTTIAHTADNVPLVYQAMYATGRLPVDKYDWAYFYHDIGSISTDGLGKALNDIAMGGSVFSHLINGDPATFGYGYPIASIPFIGLGAAAYQEGVAVFQAGVSVITSVGNAVATAWGGLSSAMGSLMGGDLEGALNSFAGGIGAAVGGFFKSIEDAIEHILPVVLDFGDKGPNILSLSHSHAMLEMSPGIRDHVAWVGDSSGILALDSNHNGVVDGASEISFMSLKAGAKSDLDGLSAMDTNHDGILDAHDKNFGDLFVWFDHNGNGADESGEAMTLVQAGVKSIDLHLNWNGMVIGDSYSPNQTTFETTSGVIHAAYDMEFAKEYTDHMIGHS